MIPREDSRAAMAVMGINGFALELGGSRTALCIGSCIQFRFRRGLACSPLLV